MMMFMRSLPAIVSKAKFNGAMDTDRALRGTTVALAFPVSEKSVSSSVISSDGSKSNTRF